MKDNEDSDHLLKWLTVINFPFLPLKTLTVEQNLWSWFSDMSPPSLQIAGLLNIAIFLFQSTLVSRVLAFKLRAADPELCNITIHVYLIYYDLELFKKKLSTNEPILTYYSVGCFSQHLVLLSTFRVISLFMLHIWNVYSFNFDLDRTTNAQFKSVKILSDQEKRYFRSILFLKSNECQKKSMMNKI